MNFHETRTLLNILRFKNAHYLLKETNLINFKLLSNTLNSQRRLKCLSLYNPIFETCSDSIKLSYFKNVKRGENVETPHRFPPSSTAVTSDDNPGGNAQIMGKLFTMLRLYLYYL